MDGLTVGAFIAAAGCIIGMVVGLAGWARNNRKDESELAAAIATIQTSLVYIEQQLAEIKSEFRRMEGDLQTANETANRALSTANAAHDRLDAMGVETASKARARTKGEL